MRTSPRRAVLLCLCFIVFPGRCAGQSATLGAQASWPVQARITQAIDPKNLITLSGNVHPLARPEFDQGAVSDAQPLHRILLLLQRSPEQETVLGQLLEEQQQKSSANYQNWITPNEFEQRFGPAEADIQTISQWLASEGFSGIKVSAGRTVLEFSGTAGQVRGAFHTEIHQYAIREKLYFANASNPQVPAALAPVVAGIVSLHNFPAKSHLHRLGTFQKLRNTGEVKPLFTFPGCQSGNCFGVGPADFATIYNTSPLLNGSPQIDGTGQGIAIVGRSNINVQDVVDFRTMFGLTQNFSGSNVILDGPDPGINNGEGEADLDVEWSGAVAPGAHIDLVTSADTETTMGVDLSAVYIVDHNLDAVMSESFGACEQDLGATLNQFHSSLWEQAAAQGITVIVSSGDNGSAGCDDFDTEQTATQGLAVSGVASTPFNVAVGGTDFDQIGRQSQFWNTSPTPTSTLPILSSAKSYIPEVPWNDTCAQNGLNGCTSGSLLSIAAGSGGVSTIYAKPSWQVGIGVPNDNHRDLPDISLFAGNGFSDSFYIMCQRDVTGTNSCNLTNLGVTFQGVGGTSVSAPAFAGIMALVNQKQATAQNPAPRQGNANYVLYALAQQENTANLSCNSSTSPAAGCNFNDVTKGNNAVPCAGGSPNCSSAAANVNGVLVAPASPSTPAYTATAGYDLATGLGSVNAQNLANKWTSVNTTATTTTLTLNNGAAVNVTHGQPIPFRIAVSPMSVTGDASLIASPTGGLSTGVGPFTLQSGVASGSTTALPGGAAYNVTAHYQGNGTDAPSDSPPVQVTITPEASKLFISLPTFDPTTGKETGNSPTTLMYGSTYILRADVTNAQGSLVAPCNHPSCPTGAVTFVDTVGGVSQGPPNSGTFSLNSAGFTEDFAVQLPGGTNVITATYSGDSSFAPSQPTTYTLSVTPVPTQMSVPYIPLSPSLVGNPVNISAFLITNLVTGAAPGGTITFYDNGSPIPGPVTLVPRAGGHTLDASISASVTATFAASGTHAITASYSGDPSYGPSTSTALNPTVLWPTTVSETASATSINDGQNVAVTAQVTVGAQSPPITGQIQFYGSTTAIAGPVTTNLSKDGNGNQILSASVTTTPQGSESIQASYSGDTNYQQASSAVFINVNTPDFSMASSPSSLTISPGQVVSSTITITPTSTSSSTVTLACGPLDAYGVTCTLSPTTVNLGHGAPVSVNLTLSMAAAPSGARVTTSVIPAMKTEPWSSVGLAVGFGAVVLLLLPRRRPRNWPAVCFAACLLVAVAPGCGGGGSSAGAGGGSSGGGGNQVPTSITVTLPSSTLSVPTTAIATATVMSTEPVGGTITFFDGDTGSAFGSPMTVTNGTAQLHFAPFLGLDQISAKYSGDSLNQASQSAPVSLLGIGTSRLSITGTTGALTHNVAVNYAVQ